MRREVIHSWYLLLVDVRSLQFIPVKIVENATNARRRLGNMEGEFIHNNLLL